MKQPLIDLKAQYQTIRSEIDSAIKSIMERTDFILGKDVQLFEEEAAKYLGVKHCVGVASGTDALLIALRAAGIQDGDEVITTPFTFIATAEAIHRAGGKAVFVDIADYDCNINTALIEKAVTKKTRAIMPVHLFGEPCDMDEILRIAKKHALSVIEDCAQSMGAVYRGKKTGSIGICGAFSFFPGKNLGCFGDGGMIATDNEDIANRSKILRNHGCEKQYFHTVSGYNSRLDTLQAAVLRVKLKYLDKWNEQRRKIALKYSDRLSKLGYKTLKSKPEKVSSMNYYSFLLQGQRDKMTDHLNSSGIANKIYYPLSLHQQDVFKYLGYKNGAYPVSERVSAEILALPMYPELTEEQADAVLDVIAKFR